MSISLLSKSYEVIIISYFGIDFIKSSLCSELPFITTTFKSGVNFAASSFQFNESELGHTTILGFRSLVFSIYDIITANSCIVFPRPISSAKIPPSLYVSSVFSQSNPTF